MKIRTNVTLAAFALLALSLVNSTRAGVGTLEQAIGVRPATLFYSTDRDTSTISNGAPDQVPFYGWSGTVGAMADWNGDGIDDKTLYQPVVGWGWQTVVAYSDPTDPAGVFMNTDWANNGSQNSSWTWYDSTGDTPIFGDIDNDGIADNGIVSLSPGDGTPNGALNWGAWRSGGTPGVSGPGPPETFAGWNAWGVAGMDTPLMGDINGDGTDDRVLFRNDFNTYVDYTDGSGFDGYYGDSTVDTQSVFGGVAGDELAIADINGDGYDDVVVIRENDMGEDYYNLFGYFSSAAGLSNGSSPDMFGIAGSLSLGDYLVFGDLGLPAAPALLADFDNDGDVDDDDRTDAIQGWETRFGGDLTGVDFINWQQEFGTGVSPAIAAAVAAVPEPTTMCLLTLSSMVMLTRRNRKK